MTQKAKGGSPLARSKGNEDAGAGWPQEGRAQSHHPLAQGGDPAGRNTGRTGRQGEGWTRRLSQDACREGARRVRAPAGEGFADAGQRRGQDGENLHRRGSGDASARARSAVPPMLLKIAGGKELNPTDEYEDELNEIG